MNQSLEKGMFSNKKTANIPILVIFAPTACGKTSLAEKLFAKNASSPLAGKAEIISADSMQVYKHLNIGTAKPNPTFLEKLPHHLIDICEPFEQFDTGHFVEKADIAAKEIFSRGKLPVLLGGTAFYIKNFLFGLPITPEPSDAVRELVEKRMQTEGAEVLYAELQKLDPESASKIHINDKYRIRRALEVCITTGKPRSSFENQHCFRPGYDFLILSLQRNRQELYRRIEKRVDMMIEEGLVQEIESLKKQGYTGQEPALQAIGYKEFFEHGATDAQVASKQTSAFSSDERTNALTQAQVDLQKIICSIKHNTKRYAKRQETFFNSMNCSKSFFAEDYNGILQEILPFYQKWFN